jgi:hypothetical protein
MHKLIVITITTFFWITTNGQTLHPGEIPGMKVWLQAQSNQEKTVLQDLIHNKTILENYHSIKINYNPAISLSDRTKPILPIADFSGDHMTVFIVFQMTTDDEESIYTLDGPNHHALVLTNYRMADLEAIKYMNFPNSKGRSPQLNTYIHSRTSGNTHKSISHLTIGQRPYHNDIPIGDFSGYLAEMMVYHRTLTPDEKHLVESYLAIKYGLTLNAADGPYTDLKGKPLWDHNSEDNFIHQITGIAIDSTYQFIQPQSQSSEGQHGIEIAFAEDKTENGQYAIIRHNNNPLNFQTSVKGQIPRLLRTWKAHTSELNKPVELSWNKHMLVHPPHEKYWLMISRNESQSFPVSHTDYIEVNQGAEGYSTPPFSIDSDQSGGDVFTIASGPSMFVQMESSGLCDRKGITSAHLKIVGGTPPFQLEIKGENQFMETMTIEDNEMIELKDIPSGKISIILEDQRKNLYKEEFYINGFYPENLNQEDHIRISKDESIVLGDNHLQDAHYTWYFNDEIIGNGPIILASKEGIYTLKITMDGCQFWKDVKVTQTDTRVFQSVNIYPNPSSDGLFRASVHLHENAALQMNITTIDGKPVTAKRYNESLSFEIEGQLLQAGIYLVTFEALNELFTQKLVVK